LLASKYNRCQIRLYGDGKAGYWQYIWYVYGRSERKLSTDTRVGDLKPDGKMYKKRKKNIPTGSTKDRTFNAFPIRR
jgi:hypothetical protein